MRIKRMSSRAAAERLRDAIAIAMGLPRDGTDVGGGIHASAAESRTLTHGDVVQHQRTRAWAYGPITPDVLALQGQTRKVRGQNTTINVSGHEEVTSDWREVPK